MPGRLCTFLLIHNSGTPLKRPTCRGWKKKKSKEVSSKHTYYQSLISTKHRLPWDLMQLIRGENTNKQTKSSSISQGRGWGNQTSGIFVEELHKTNGLGELKSMGRGQFVTDHCHLNMACWQLNEEQNKKGMCFIWAGLVPCVHSQWKIQSRRESVSLPAQLSTHITPWHTPQDLLQAHKWGHYFFTCWKNKKGEEQRYNLIYSKMDLLAPKRFPPILWQWAPALSDTKKAKNNLNDFLCVTQSW